MKDINQNIGFMRLVTYLEGLVLITSKPCKRYTLERIGSDVTEVQVRRDSE